MTSGSRAALTIVVSPLASVAAIITFSVPVTVTIGKMISAPRQAFRRARMDIAVIERDFGAEFCSAVTCKSTGRVPMAQPPGSETFASPRARQQRPQHQNAGAHFAHQFIRRGDAGNVLGLQLHHAAGVAAAC